jgi:ABC-type transport system involved in multi-copper enzyme maturation permease subunit
VRPPTLRILTALSGEAFRDATRRRIVPVVAAVSLLSLLAVDTCSGCAGGNIVANGQPVDLSQVAGWSGMVMFSSLALWVMVLAGLLASDHLSETLEDGSAALVLSRPVRRSEFVLARLAGSLGIAYVTGVVILGGAALMLHFRSGLSLGGAAWGMLACAAGTLIIGALSMALSLYLKRLATALLVMILVGAVALTDSFALLGTDLGGIGYVLQRFAPPLFVSVVLAVSDWIEPVTLKIDPVILALKLVFWMVASLAFLLVAFRREELSG